MTEDVSAGRLHLDAYIDTTGVTRGLQRRLDAQTQNIRAKIKTEIDSRGTIRAARDAAKRAGDSAKVRIKAEIDSVGLIAAARAAASAASAAARLEINLDIDTAQATAQLAAWRAAQKANEVDLDVDVDTAGAEAQIDALRARQMRNPINLNFNLGGFNPLGNLGSQLMRLSKIPALVGGIYTLGSAAVSAAGGLFAMGSAASQAAGALAVLPNLAGMAVQGIGALIIGFSGIGDAVSALAEAEQSATEDTEAYAQAQEDAARRIADAQRALREARHNAADSARSSASMIENAEWSLARAQESALDAQSALNDARREARDRIRDLNTELALTANDEAAAMARLTKAREDLQDVKWDQAASQQERRAAEIAVLEAEGNLDRVRAKRADLTQETREANREGVEGSDEVQAAHERIRDTTHALTQAEEALKEARHQAADAAYHSAQAIADAQRALADAHRAAKEAAEDQGAALDKVTDAMDNLSPAGERFARFIYSLKPRWTEVKHAVQGALLPPIQRGVEAALPFLDTLQTGLTDTARRTGRLVERLGEMMGGKAFRGDSAAIMEENNRALSRFGRAGLNLTRVMQGLARVAGPTLLRPFSKWIEKVTHGWRETIKAKRRNGELRDTFVAIRDRVKQVASIIGNLTGALWGMGEAASGPGGDLLALLDKTAQRWNEMANSPEGKARMEEWFEAVKPITAEVGELIVNLLDLLAAMGGENGGAALGFLKGVNAIIEALTWLLGLPGVGEFIGFLMAIMGALGAIGFIAGGLISALTPVFAVIGWIGSAIGAIVGFLAPIGAAFAAAFAVTPVGAIIGALLLVAGVFLWLYNRVDWFRKGVDTAVGWIVDAFWWLVDAAEKLWDEWFGHSVFPDIVDGIKWAADMIRKSLRFIWLGIKALGTIAKWLWDKAVKPAWEGITAAISFAWRNYYKPILTALWEALKVVGGWFSWLWDKAVRPAWSALTDAIRKGWNKYLRPAFDAIGTAVGTLRDIFAKGIGGIVSIWEGLQKAADTVGRFLVETVYMKGIKPVIDAIPGVGNLPDVKWVGYGNKTTPKPPARTRHIGGMGNDLALARGGILPGYTPGKDVHRFYSPTAGGLALSGGEGIAVPQVVRAIGARGWDMLNAAGRRGAGAVRDALAAIGDRAHHFARGGIVYVDGEPMTRIAAAQLAIAERASGIPMSVMQGAYQSASSYSGTSHTGGGVMDTSPGSFKAQEWLRKVAFAAWARNIPGAATAGSGAHVHAVSRIDPTSVFHSQLSSFARGEDGLGGPDYGPNPSPVASLVSQVRTLAGMPLAQIGKASKGGDGVFSRMLDAIDVAKDFISKIPDWFDEIRGMGGFGRLIVDAIKDVLGDARGWINGKIPGPGPIPNIFDKGGDWHSGVLGINQSGRTETVFTNENIVDITDRLATLSRNLTAMTHARTPDGGLAPLVGELTLMGRKEDMPNLLRDANYELRRIRRGGVHASRT